MSTPRFRRAGLHPSAMLGVPRANVEGQSSVSQSPTPRRRTARPARSRGEVRRDEGEHGVLVLKLGGELIESADARARLAPAIAARARAQPLVVVHGGGHAIDAELGRRGIAPKKVDGLRVTDPATLDAVVAVLAGSANTDLVAALVAAGVRAVGLTGVDAACGRATRVPPVAAPDGRTVDLGLVGDPSNVDASLIDLLIAHNYVPVIASLGLQVPAAPKPRSEGGTTPPHLQAAVAYGLAKGEDYFTGLMADMQRRRDRLARAASAATTEPTPQPHTAPAFAA